MNDDRLRDLYRKAMAARAAGSGQGSVPVETIVDVIEGRLSDAEHRRALLHIMSDPQSKREFDLLRSVVEGTAERPARRLMRAAWPLQLAAVLALTVGAGAFLRTWQARQAGDVARAAEESGPVALVSPQPGKMAATERLFIWRPVPGALRYQFDLLTTGGRLVFSATQTDTVLTLPDSVRLSAGEELRWWVEATTADGRQERSAVRRLSVVQPPKDRRVS